MDGVDDTSAVLQAAGLHQPPVEEAPSLLCVIIDTHAEGWHKLEGWSFKETMASVMVLLNAHMALSNANDVAVLGFNGMGPRMVYPQKEDAPLSDVKLEGTMYRQFHKMDKTVLAALATQLQETTVNKHCSISAPLTLALCYTQRIMRQRPGTRGRILLVSVTGDVPSKYISTMNSIFAAQKAHIPIDVCKLGGEKTNLQQAADFTGGAYIDIAHPRGLVQYFMSTFLIDPATRQMLNQATQPEVDFRAVCFLTKEVVEIGHVCSVCLCIMKDEPDGSCPICHTVFESTQLPSFT
ncbi:RNA polymerase II transcription factor B subunit 4 [Wickerhamiella sorbophila]|uniref:General transcription and DNA repair factor IIH subunit TFB4 n=1 Tax=Wickerhamiella sorbophila TaxID=45607 RepID=A0A2T0FLD1_9ASCO|nr:RNA polymerase II transcription factor B subunit 4 [Wickerhamiella sorbophila]PRT55803.1 RNA polymerase II transcription factor B subunit 4 [Wickerhamiella sorbophila]